jgi:SAM-dependent methyltransferase
MTEPSDSAAGAALYSPFVLRFYDPVVHGFNLPVLWRCRTGRVQRLYDEHASANHLDIGVGTGYYLDRCRFQVPPKRIVLFDLNPNSLACTARRLARYEPTTQAGDVLAPFDPAPAAFDSVGMATFLHCVPGPMEHKARAFDHVAAVMNAGAVVFGSTLLGRGVRVPWTSRLVMRAMNRRGIFSNANDDPTTLRAALDARFDDVEIEVVGLMALFVARNR